MTTTQSFFRLGLALATTLAVTTFAASAQTVDQSVNPSVNPSQNQNPPAKRRAVRVRPVNGATPTSVTDATRPDRNNLASPIDAPGIESRYSPGLKWSAFIDAEGRYGNQDTFPQRGFSINDADLMLSKEFNQAKALIDLPFYSDSAGGTSRFIFANQESQAYLELDRWANTSLRAGQFDTFFGVEANHSRDRFFANVGLLKTFFVPYTHTGAQATYKANNMTIRGQLTNPNGDGGMAQNNPEFAGDFRMEMNNNSYGAIGASVNQARASTASNNTNLLVDLTGGVAKSNFRIDGEIDAKTSANTNKTGLGFGVFGTFPTSDLLAFGLRAEYGKDVYGAAGNANGTYDSIFSFAAGPSYKLMPEVTLRGDFSLATYSTPGTSTTPFGVSASLVVQL